MSLENMDEKFKPEIHEGRGDISSIENEVAFKNWMEEVRRNLFLKSVGDRVRELPRVLIPSAILTFAVSLFLRDVSPVNAAQEVQKALKDNKGGEATLSLSQQQLNVIRGPLLDLQGDEPPKLAEMPVTVGGVFTARTSGEVNLRSGRGTRFNILGSIPSGTVVEFQFLEGDAQIFDNFLNHTTYEADGHKWVVVVDQDGNYLGFVAGDLLTPESPQVSPAPPAPTTIEGADQPQETGTELAPGEEDSGVPVLETAPSPDSCVSPEVKTTVVNNFLKEKGYASMEAAMQAFRNTSGYVEGTEYIRRGNSSQWLMAFEPMIIGSHTQSIEGHQFSDGTEAQTGDFVQCVYVSSPDGKDATGNYHVFPLIIGAKINGVWSPASFMRNFGGPEAGAEMTFSTPQEVEAFIHSKEGRKMHPMIMLRYLDENGFQTDESWKTPVAQRLLTEGYIPIVSETPAAYLGTSNAGLDPETGLPRGEQASFDDLARILGPNDFGFLPTQINWY